jgi:hypothetical protein
MQRQRIPSEILDAAHARSQARAARDWAEADRLRAVIDAAGWKIVDRGTDFALSPVHAPDVVDAGVARYGSSASVPSRLEEPETGLASVVVVSAGDVGDLERTHRGLTRAADGIQAIVVANEPPPYDATALAALETRAATSSQPLELLWTSDRLGHATALNAGIRRAAAGVVVILDPSVELTGDAITPLVRALDDPTVAVAGPFGLVSGDLRHFEEAPAGEVDAVEAYCLAFRRSDYRARGPLDEKFRFYRNLDIWWSLVLRDAGEGSPPRRAVALAGLPLIRHEHKGWTSVEPAERDRLSKRNFYRILDRFGSRADLLAQPAEAETG